jgi:hypothetical protein
VASMLIAMTALAPERFSTTNDLFKRSFSFPL